MAFPTNGGAAATNSASGTPHSVSLPATPAAGDALVVVGRANAINGANDFAFPSGWVKVVDVTQAGTSSDRFCIYYKILVAGDAEIGAGTISVTPPASSKASYVCQRVVPPAGEALQTPEWSTQASGASATPDPPNLALAGGVAKDVFWLWLGGWEGEQTSPPATPPSNYTQQGASSGTAGNVDTNTRVLIARRSLNASAENPPAVTISASDDWVAYTGAFYSAVALTNYELDCQPGSFSITGVTATVVRGLVIDSQPTSYAVTGVAASVVRGYPLNAAPGSYAITGVAATLLATRLLNSAPGSFTITGVAASTLRDYPLNAAAGSYAITGVAATPLATRLVSADPAAFAITGSAAALLAARLLSADPGTYTLTGAAADLVYGSLGPGDTYTLNLEPGSFAVAGLAASVLAARSLNAQPGAVGLTGVGASVVATRVLSGDPGSCTISGAAAGVVAGRSVDAQPGAYALTGEQAGVALDRALGAEAATFTLTGAPAFFLAGQFASPPVTSVTRATVSGRTGSAGRRSKTSIRTTGRTSTLLED